MTEQQKITVEGKRGKPRTVTLSPELNAQLRAVQRRTRRMSLYLSQAQIVERLGLARGSLSKYKLPPPDAIIGPVNDDGSLPRGTVRGWLPETIDEWNASRPGQGKRTDLQ
jgi:hypothetical protein